MKEFISDARTEIDRTLIDLSRTRSLASQYKQHIQAVYDFASQQNVSPQALAAELTKFMVRSAPTPEIPSQTIGIGSQTPQVSPSDLARIAAVLQTQVTRDLKTAWDVDASVLVLDSVDAVPSGVWPIVITADVPGGLSGLHSEFEGTSFAVVKPGPDVSASISRQLVSMLVNPHGNRTISGPSLDPADKGKAVDYVADIAAPVKGTYLIDGLAVSDFIFPAWFDGSAAPTPHGQYNMTGTLTRALQIGESGFASWIDPETDTLKQARLFEGTEPTIVSLGKRLGPNETAA